MPSNVADEMRETLTDERRAAIGEIIAGLLGLVTIDGQPTARGQLVARGVADQEAQPCADDQPKHQPEEKSL